MKLSEAWLREWVNPAVDTEALVAQLTMAGLEVDAVSPVAGAFSGVVVGHVVALAPHPDADRLRVCQVDVGEAGTLQIVCGAPNVHVGMRAPVATVGAELPGGLKIRRSKLRGVESQGMLCSARELGLSEDASGLMPLPADSRCGQCLRQLLALDDRVLEIDLTPNRGDCLSVAGIAREIGALQRVEVCPVPVVAVPPSIDARFPVELAAAADCPRYVGRVVRGVNPAAATPLWMVERLRRAGMRSLGPLVDVTNYVMLELGQPLHAFDLDRLQGGIVVRRAQPGDSLELLNGNRVEPDADTLLICDASGPLALAGIMGGEGSGCGDDTRNVFLESAFFAPAAIAGRARRYGLHTDSSHRFERGVDPQLQARAMERATALLLAIAGGEAGALIEACAEQHLPRPAGIRLRAQRLHGLLGFEVDPGEVDEILARLGMAVSAHHEGWLVVPPSFRFDVAIEVDLIEEIARVHGYARLPSHRPALRLEMAPLSEASVEADALAATLVERGYQEAITYSFVDPEFQSALDPERAPIALANPISADLAVMRTQLWPGLLKAVQHNQKRQQPRIRLFETGLGFVRDGDTTVQDRRIAGAVCGDALGEQWGSAARRVDFFDLKGDVEALLRHWQGSGTIAFVAAAHPALHPGQSAAIERDGVHIGWLGALHPAVARRLDIDGDVLLFELYLERLGPAATPVFGELSKYPSIRRDLAFVVGSEVAAEAVRQAIVEEAGPLLRGVNLFDVYAGKGVGEGRKSLAFGLILQEFSSTLTDEAVDQVIERVVTGLARRHGAVLRT